MKKYLVIGNPIKHSLSPKLHNYWIKENNIDAVYNKKQLNENDIRDTINEVANGKIDGINVTVPFKKSVIPFLNELTPLAKEAQSVNTIYKKDGKAVGDNTDIGGFRYALKHIGYNVSRNLIINDKKLSMYITPIVVLYLFKTSYSFETQGNMKRSILYCWRKLMDRLC